LPTTKTNRDKVGASEDGKSVEMSLNNQYQKRTKTTILGVSEKMMHAFAQNAELADLRVCNRAGNVIGRAENAAKKICLVLEKNER
jgi:hypothetical protein